MSTPTPFTYDNFPNLWDEILAASDVRSLVKLRCVCRKLQAVVEGRMRHVVLKPDPGMIPLRYSLERPPHAALARPFLCPHVQPVILKRDCESPEWDCDHHDNNCAEPGAPARAQYLLTRSARVVDMQGLFNERIYFRGDYPPYFPKAHTLRLTQDPEFGWYQPDALMDCRILVLFPHPKGMMHLKEHPYYEDSVEWSKGFIKGGPPPRDWTWGLEPDPPRNVGPKATWPRMPTRLPHRLRDVLTHNFSDVLPIEVRRIVVNLDGGAVAPTDSFHVLRGLDRHVREVVIVVPRIRSPTDRGALAASASEREITRSVLDAMRSPFAKHVVVGLELLGDDFAGDLRDRLVESTLEEVQPFVDYSIDDARTLAMDPIERERYTRLAEHMRKEKSYWQIDDALRKPEEEEDVAVENNGCPHDECDGCCDEPNALAMAEGPAVISLEQKVNSRLQRLETLTVQEYRERVGMTRAAVRTVQYPAALRRYEGE